MRMVRTTALAFFSLLLLRSNAVPINKNEVQPCSSGFSAYNGWCVAISSSNMMRDQAVDYCKNIGSVAPSLHSQSDANFWALSVYDLKPINDHFWLDATCTSKGDLYQWGDGSETDFVGPSRELTSCDPKYGIHMHNEGMMKYEPNVVAPALCAYRALLAAPELPSTVAPTTIAPTTEAETTLAPATIEPTDAPIDYCTCDPSSVYLDVAFIVDASADMTEAIVADASATIQSLLFGLSHGTQMFQTNVATVAYAESVKVVSNFGDIRTVPDILNFDIPYLGGNATKMRDAVKKATALISANSRNYTRGAIFLISKSFDQLDAVNIFAAAQEFKDNGGIFISIDYTNGGYVKGLEAIASPGYYINDAKTPNSLVPDMLYALCDANCFCPKSQTPYNVPNANGRAVPMGCYHVADSSAVYAAAEPNCAKQHGFVATIHDDAKNFFMISIFPPKTPFWIGLQRSGNSFAWADGSNDQSSFWAPGNPVNGKDCVYAVQTTGLNSMWYSAPCADPLKNTLTYSCQLTPCSSEYNCYSHS